jgi:DNA repair and recombination protein RAD54B
MHTKDVKKKHKVFDDGVLGVRGGSCTLYAMDGAVLSKSSSYSAKVLSTLVVGAELRLGARDVEVGERLANELFDSGSVFLGASAIDAAPGKAGAAAAMPPTLKFKKFVSHKEAFAGEIASRPSALAPRHDPDAEGAVVLWTPPTSADVHIVVDPFVAARLRPHQVAGVRFLFEAVARGTGCILADEMGLGKTLMSIALLWTVLKQGTPALGMPTIARRALIAVPTSLTANWVKEIKKWLGPERLRPLSIIDDDKAAIADKLRTFGAASNASPNVLVISYEQLRIHADALAAVGPISLCICDEGHRLKNPGAAITKALRALQCQSRIILSGTPIQNELNEFYAMLSFACPQLLDTLSPAAFKRLYTGPIMRAREADAKADVKQLGAQRRKARAADCQVCAAPHGGHSQPVPAAAHAHRALLRAQQHAARRLRARRARQAPPLDAVGRRRRRRRRRARVHHAAQEAVQPPGAVAQGKGHGRRLDYSDGFDGGGATVVVVVVVTRRPLRRALAPTAHAVAGGRGAVHAGRVGQAGGAARAARRGARRQEPRPRRRG